MPIGDTGNSERKVNEMEKSNAYVEVIYCMSYYLHDISKWAKEDYFRMRKEEILEAGKEVLDESSYKTLKNLVGDYEVKENE